MALQDYRRIFYTLLLLGTVIYALWRGRTPERLVAITIALDVVLSNLAASPFQMRFLRMEAGVALADTLGLVALAVIVKLTGKPWIIWITGLKLFQVASHLPILLQPPDVSPRAYYVIQAALSYPDLILLLIATSRARRKPKPQKPEPMPTSD